MKDSMKKSSPAAIEENKAELADWQVEMDRLQALRPVQSSRDRLKAKEIPLLESQIKQQEDAHPEISQKAEKVWFEITGVTSFDIHLLSDRGKAWDHQASTKRYQLTQSTRDLCYATPVWDWQG